MMITDVEDFFTKGCGRCSRFDTPDCSTKFWPQGLQDLRRICLDMGLSEHVKWAHPCYMHAGRNICIFGAFRGDYRLTFMNASLMKDPEGIMVRQGQNTRHPDMICFTDDAQVNGQLIECRYAAFEVLVGLGTEEENVEGRGGQVKGRETRGE